MALRLPKINRQWLLLGMALVLGLVATYLAVGYLKSREKRIEAELAERAKGGPTVAVVVPSVDVARGTVVSGKHFVSRNIPADLVYGDMITVDQYDSVSGRRLLRAVERGRPLRRADVFTERPADFSDVIPEGKRALTIDIDELNSIAQMLRPGNYVDLYLIAASHGGAGGGQEVYPLLDHVKVVATGQELQSDTSAAEGEGVAAARQQQYSNITVEVTPEDAARIALAQQSGRIRAALRNPKDEEESEIGKVDTASLLSGPAAAGAAVQFYIGGGGTTAPPININVPGLQGLLPGTAGAGQPQGRPGQAPASVNVGEQFSNSGLPPSVTSRMPTVPTGAAPQQ